MTRRKSSLDEFDCIVDSRAPTSGGVARLPSGSKSDSDPENKPRDRTHEYHEKTIWLHELIRVRGDRGVDHSERAFIALSVAARHSVVKEDLRERYARGLLGEAEIERARATALALRLAYTVSGGVISLLEQTAIRRKDGRLILILPEHGDILVGDIVERRFRALARAVECEAEIAYEPDVEKAIA